MAIDQNQSQGEDESQTLSASTPEAEPTENTTTDNQGNEDGSQEQKVEFSPEQQAVIDGVASKKTRKIHEQRQRAEAAESRVRELEAQRPVETEPVVPPMPNRDDFIGEEDKFDVLIATRDEANANRAVFLANQSRTLNDRKEATERSQREIADKEKKEGDAYFSRSKDFGIDKDKMVNDMVFVGDSIKSPEIHSFLVTNELGPVITAHLASNMQDLDTVKNMNSVEFGAYFETTLKPKLSSAREKTKAPTPATPVEGKAAPEGKDPLIEGATFT